MFVVGLMVLGLGSVLTVRGELVEFTVTGVVQPLQQVGDTCWATTATMLIAWKQNQSRAVADVAAQAGPKYRALYLERRGLPVALKAEFLGRLGLRAIPPACYLPDGLLRLLREHGAIWVTLDSSAEAFTHAVIVTGMTGDGTGPGTAVRYVDPADGKPKSLNFDLFQARFESAAGKAEIQIVTAN